MSDTPSSLQDAKDNLSADGFAVAGDTWYHGTSSALLELILAEGLKRSGDKAIKQVAKETMATIGNSYTESIEPIFLTQSKELAHYWAKQTVRDRSVRFETEEQPSVIAIKLPAEQYEKIKPDVGAASLLLIPEGEKYLAYIANICQKNGIAPFSIDLIKADRTEYLTKLGMAYINQDIGKQYLEVIEA